MRAIVKTDTKVLIPNKEHLNFTDGKEIIKANTQVEGEFKHIKGKRRGQDFVYRLFATSDGKLIYSNKIENMKTEVNLGADESVSSTVVNIPVEKKLFSKNAIIYAAIGAGIGIAYTKFYKKMPNKKVAMWSSIAAVVGFGVGTLVDKRKSVKVQPSR